jgi:hypothetical protein
MAMIAIASLSLIGRDMGSRVAGTSE